jgi:TRAP-type C4-dicarboxylate transport system substrate-binding protein
MFRLALALTLAATSAPAQTAVRIKLGTLAPQGSTWHQQMVSMAQDFSKASNGKVELKIYAGGTQGNEGEMIRKMSIGQLHAASITAIGLHEITPEPQAEDVPFMIDSYQEYDYVHERVRGRLEEAIAQRSYQVLQWGEVGFVYLFSTQPYRSPSDFGNGKVFTWNGDPGAEAAWKAAGFHPVVLSSTDLVPALTSGMINIIGQSPLYAYTTNLYSRAGNMLNLPWGFLTGATVVRKDAWEKIPKDVRQELLKIAEDYSKKTRDDVRKQNEDAIQQMKKRGLKVNAPLDLPGWHQAADRAKEVVRGKVVPAGIYDEVMRLRDEYRAQKKQP